MLCQSGVIEPHHLPPALHGGADLKPLRGKGPATLKALEALHITDAIRRHGGNRTAAAKELGIDPSTLFRKIKSLGIELAIHDRPGQKK